MPTMDIDDLRAALGDYLMGYARDDAARLRAIAARPWRLAARIEQLHRATGFVGVLSDDLLAAIAAGDLDVADEATRLAQHLAGQTGTAVVTPTKGNADG